MVPAEEDEKRSGRRGHEDESVLRERIWVEQALAGGFVTDGVLLGLAGAVQDGQVQVGGCVVDRHIPGVGAEELVRDQGREGKRQRRVLAWMRLELKRSSVPQGLQDVGREVIHRVP